MPYFIIERNFAEQLEANPEIAAAVNDINDAAGVNWLISFPQQEKGYSGGYRSAPVISRRISRAPIFNNSSPKAFPTDSDF